MFSAGYIQGYMNEFKGMDLKNEFLHSQMNEWMNECLYFGHEWAHELIHLFMN